MDSGKPQSLYGKFDIISAFPDIVIDPQRAECPFAAAQQLLDELSVKNLPKNHPFTGGIMGYWAYPSTTSTAKKEPIHLPGFRLGRYLWSLVFNHQTQEAQLFALEQCPNDVIEQVLDNLARDIAQPAEFTLQQQFAASTAKIEYLTQIKTIKDYITAGDCYQVNLSQHFKAPYLGDLWQAYCKLRQALPSPFSAYMAWDDNAILSLSPERFIKLSDGNVETKPIKGTLPRGATIDEDQQLAVQLQNSIKDRAENLMIVDLLRNDLGKTCIPGSIKVPKLFDLESYRNVHHLVSTVIGKLAPSHSAVELLQGCFPGGSITGAPKKRAMEIIDQLEQHQRSIYCGSIGYISLNGRMDSNIAIRTMAADGEHLHCWGGGGIVADSDAEAEYSESINKVAILMDTLTPG